MAVCVERPSPRPTPEPTCTVRVKTALPDPKRRVVECRRPWRLSGARPTRHGGQRDEGGAGRQRVAPGGSGRGARTGVGHGDRVGEVVARRHRIGSVHLGDRQVGWRAPTCRSSVALLLPVLPSPLVEVTVAVLVSTVPARTLGSTCNVSVKTALPTANDGLEQMTAPPVVHVQPATAGSETKVVPAGSGVVPGGADCRVRTVVGHRDGVGQVRAGGHRVGAVRLGDGHVGDLEQPDEHRIVVGSPVGRGRLEHDARRHEGGAVRLLLEGRLTGESRISSL